MRITKFALAAVLGMGSVAFADVSVDQQLQEMRQQLQAQNQKIQQQQSEIAHLRAGQDQSWMTEQRAAQVKQLVREVLSDADTRASLMDSAITAGHNGQHFFLASENGDYLMNIFGQMQIRYMYNHARQADHPLEGSANNINDTEGFQIRRAKLGVGGHVVNPKLTYGLVLNAAYAAGFAGGENIGAAFDDTTGNVYVEQVWAAYDIADGWNLKGGRFKAPFLREMAVDSAHQLAIERSYIADYFSVYYTEGVQVSYSAEQWRAMAMLHDGTRAANSDYNADLTDVALAGRAEYLVAGTWSQFDDFQTWSGDQMGVLVGAGIDWENAKTGGLGSDTNNFDVLKWTVDVSVEVPDLYGFNAFAAVVGQHLNPQFAGNRTADQYGFVAQAGIFVQPDKWDIYARYEYVNFDGMTYLPEIDSQSFNTNSTIDNQVQIITVGTNYYIKKHEAKLSLDVMWVDGAVELSDSGVGLARTPAIDQLAVRAQFQLLF